MILTSLFLVILFYRISVLCLLVFVFFQSAWAQDSLSTQNNPPKKEKAYKLFPIPIAFYTPETGLGLGVGVTSVVNTPNGVFMPRKSQVTLGFAYTTLKQTLLYLPFSLYLAQQKVYLMGELGYFDYTFRYFGFTNGVEADSIEFYRANFPRVRLNANYQLADGIFVGPRLVYDRFDFTSFAENGRLEDMSVPGSEDHFVASIGAGLVLDGRDNVLFPTKGYWVDMAFQQSVNPEYMYSSFSLDASNYVPWSTEGVLAINAYYNGIMGEAPFTAYPKLGGTKKLRGYFEGSIMQKHVAALQLELRKMLFWRLGAVVFVGFGNAAEKLGNAMLDNTQVAGGAGIRVRLTDKLNARVDYSIGLKDRSGFYITFGEAF
ncbi:MAG: BamA/TamA family outer membrane protein [Luteibaculum sp.]